VDAPHEGSPFEALKRHRSLWVVASCQIGGAAALTTFLTFWPTFAHDARGLSLSEAALLMGLLPLGSILGSLASGLLAKRLRRKRTILGVAGFGLIGAYLALLSITAWPLLVFLMLLTGFFCFVVVPVIFSFPYEFGKLKPREIAVAVRHPLPFFFSRQQRPAAFNQRIRRVHRPAADDRKLLGHIVSRSHRARSLPSETCQSAANGVTTTIM
jgi:hypothetical protein